MSHPEFDNLKLAAASPSRLGSCLHADSYAQSTRIVVPDPPQAEWAAEAISNLRHVVSGISVAFIIEGMVALCIFATWNLGHIR